MYLGLYYTCLCLHICMYLYIYGDDGFGTNKSFRKKKKIHLPFLSGLYCICIYMCLMRIYCESLCIYIHITYTRENSDYIEDDNEDVFMINIYTYVCLYPSIWLSRQIWFVYMFIIMVIGERISMTLRTMTMMIYSCKVAGHQKLRIKGMHLFKYVFYVHVYVFIYMYIYVHIYIHIYVCVYDVFMESSDSLNFKNKRYLLYKWIRVYVFMCLIY
jgi:hypothetical protein